VELAAKARRERERKTAQLEAHRDELLRLRRDGDSVEVLATALRGLGVAISDEALRLWLNRELGHMPIKRRKTRVRFDRRAATPSLPVASPVAVTATPLPAAIVATASADTGVPQAAATHSAGRPSSLILPGETAMQAMRRRLAALDAAKAGKSGTN